jgi:hypothetical protein
MSRSKIVDEEESFEEQLDKKFRQSSELIIEH